MNYRLDFYCAEAKLGVEFDGEQHDSVADSVRDDHLATFGILVHRISNRALFMLDDGPITDTFDVIRQICEERTGRQGTRFEL